MLTEGEFDALIAQQTGAGLIAATAFGSAANKHINPRWFKKLIAAPRILACMDADAAGDAAVSEISVLSHAVWRVQVPFGKDVTDFYLQAGQAALRDWIVDFNGEAGY